MLFVHYRLKSLVTYITQPKARAFGYHITNQRFHIMTSLEMSLDILEALCSPYSAILPYIHQYYLYSYY